MKQHRCETLIDWDFSGVLVCLTVKSGIIMHFQDMSGQVPKCRAGMPAWTAASRKRGAGQRDIPCLISINP